MATILISLLTTHTRLCCVHIFSVGTRVATESEGMVPGYGFTRVAPRALPLAPEL